MSSLPPHRRRRRAHDESIPLEPDITPTKIRQPVDQILDSLNAKWDLELPRLHGRDAEKSESTPLLAKRCSARLRFLYYRSINLGQLLREFDEKASLIRSGWIFKPLAEGSVTPSRAPADSTLGRRILKGKLPQLDDAQRQALLLCLEQTLEESYELAKQSSSFTGTSPGQHSYNPRQSSAYSPLTMKGHAKVTKPAARKSPPINKSKAGYRSSTKRQNEPATETATPVKKTKMVENDIRPYMIKPAGPTRLNTSVVEEALAREHQDFMNGSIRSISASNSTVALSDVADNSLPPSQNSAIDALFNGPELNAVPLPSMTTGDSGYQSSSPAPLSDRLKCTIDDAAITFPSTLDITYEFAYELQSLALSWSERAMTLRTSVVNRCKTETPSVEMRMAAYKDIANGRAHEPFTTSSWEPSAGLPKDRRLHRSVYQEASLSWRNPKASKDSPFTVRLRAPRTQQSCRLHRKFGGDRFLTLNIPDRKKDIMPNVSDQDFRGALSEWLCKGIKLGHRYWVPFWVEDKTRQDKHGNWIYQVHLFATTGAGIEPLSLREFLDSHTPLADNKGSSDNKLFARMKLGLSKTRPTVLLRKHHFRKVDDIHSSDGIVMTDGCALMSADLGIAIAHKLNLDEVPSAFQGRISGAKGMWLVDKRSSFSFGGSGTDYWIEVRPSQLKILPHPAQRDCGDEDRTFEVSDWSKTLRPSALNTQFINVLHNGGVGREILGARLKKVTADYYNELCESLQLDEPLLTRAWLQKWHAGKGQRPDFDFVGACPIAKIDRIKTCLDAGFRPREFLPLHGLLTDILRVFLNDFIEKPRIELPRSTFAFMVPDVWGILQAGEIQLCLGQPWIDPDTGMESTFVAGVHGLIARNPANHPGDVQRVWLANYAEFAGYSNLVFISTKGRRPLADLLSGGDYDGDQAFVCWDSEIVDSFQNFRGGPPDHIEPEQVRLVKCSKPLAETFIGGPNNGINERNVLRYVRKCLEFSLRQSYVGIVTNTHVQYVYALSVDKDNEMRSKALESDGAITLAALAAFLVDASKQGYDLRPESWHAAKRDIVGSVQLKKPAYLGSEELVPGGIECENILNYLRFEVARPHKDYILHKWWEFYRTLSWRADASLLTDSEWLQSEVEKQQRESNGTFCRKLIDQLKSETDDVFESWKLAVNQKAGKDLAASRKEIERACNTYRAIVPREPEDGEDHWIYRSFMAEIEGRNSGTTWRSAKASFLYKNFPNSNFVWSMAGMDLCAIKAQAVPGNVVAVQARTYSTMKINGKMAKILSEMTPQEEQETKLLNEDEETQYYDAQTSLTEAPRALTIRDYF